MRIARCLFFFFQAEDGIRDWHVTGVQTCALPIFAGTYEIIRVLGAGGMGTVYEAQDRVLNRRVALKVPQSLSPELSLRKEAQALAAIRHPSMVTVYAVQKHRGIEFLVMELVRGKTLHDHIYKQVRAG